MRSRNLVLWVLSVLAVAVVCLTLLCSARSCARRIERAVKLPGLLSPQPKPEPSTPTTAAPGKAATPASTRRPVFGTERSEGTLIEILRPSDSVKLRVRKDGSVVNVGPDTLTLRVTRVGPAWFQWDPGAGVCVLGAPGRSERALVPEFRGLHLDFGVKGKAVDFCPGAGLEIGLPVFYVTTAGPGFGLDLKHDAVFREHLTLDAAWFPLIREWQFGIGLAF